MRYLNGACIKARDLKIASFFADSAPKMGELVDTWLQANTGKRIFDVQIHTTRASGLFNWSNCYGFVLYAEGASELFTQISPMMPDVNVSVKNITQHTMKNFTATIERWLADNPDKLIAGFRTAVTIENCFAYITSVGKS